MTGWTTLHGLLDRCDETAVTSAVRDLEPGQRQELAGPLRQYERELRADQMRWWPRQPALAVAGAGALPSAAALAPWLARNSLSRHMPPPRQRISATDLVLEVLRAREVSWLGDLARRLAGRLATRWIDPDLWRLVSELVTLTGIDPPTTDGFVIGWAEQHRGEHRVVAGDIRRDPRLAALIPRLFEIERLPRGFAWSGSPWPETLAQLAAERLVDRVVLLDSCLAALQRGGRLGAAQGCLRVHEALAPTGSEVASRTADYAALLPDSHSVVAAMAQRELRRRDEAGSLPAGTLSQISKVVLARTEKTLVRAQLAWLDAAARRDPGQASEIVPAMAVAFGQHASDLQRLALASAIKHLSALDGAARAELAAAAREFPADLRAAAAEAFGDPPADPPGSLLASAAGNSLAGTLGRPPAASARPVPPVAPRELLPIGSPEELAAEITSLHAQLPDRFDPVSLERVLAGVVAISGTDRTALAAALGRFLDQNYYIIPGHAARLREGSWPPVWYGEWYAIISAAIVPALRPARGDDQAAGQGPGWRALISGSGVPSLQAALMLRLNEIATGLSYDPRPLLLSTPTTAHGLIDPADLTERMRRAAAEGWEPWPVDLAQALLRLPRAPDPATAAEVRKLGTPAALTVARRLSAGSPADPEVASELRTFSELVFTGYGPNDVKRDRILAVARSRAPGQPGDPSTLADDLDAPERWHQYFDHTAWMSCWPLMLPAHRDVAAAHLVPYLSARAGQGRSGLPLLPPLAAAEGPVGDGMNLALAYGLGASDRADRSGAVDALITLAARGQLDGAALGRPAGVLVARGDLLLNRVVPGLRDVAGAGAPAPVWALVAAALPLMLPPAAERPPHALAALVELGVDLAETCRPTAPLPCLEPVAARRGPSQLVTQARRLQQALARGAAAP